MKLHFEPDLDYQLRAIEAVSDLFKGQEVCRTEFTVTRQALDGQMAMGFAQSDLGIGNRLALLDDDLLKNINAIQLRNGLAPSATLASGDFTDRDGDGNWKDLRLPPHDPRVEQTFRIQRSSSLWCPPSPSRRECISRSRSWKSTSGRCTRTHRSSTSSTTRRSWAACATFATSPHIQIMVVTVGAINKKEVNNLYKDSEKTGGETPIDLIRATKPVLIVDEPQSVDGGIEGRGREALAEMHPSVYIAVLSDPLSTGITWSTGWTPWMLMSRSWSSKSRSPPPPSRMRTIHRTCV